ncbi:hypothetical protein AOA12_13030 [Microbacterium sp. No. 7]|nr:hypothetical protein AOA12_13030 [Microbacterium sp. No. 7]
MRSRFTAFALGDAAHLRRTWHPSTRPSDLVLDPAVAWERLEVVHADGDTVTFRAHWRDAGTGERGVLAEVSRFVLRGSRWVYLDGAVA